MKKIAVLLLVLFLIPFTSFGYTSSGKPYVKSGFISGIANLSDISNFGGIVIKNITVADMQKAGFDIDDYTYADFWFFKRDLNQKAEEQGKESARIIFLLGDMKDIDMQHSVNEFIANRNITIMCYNVGRLLSYHTPDGTFLENVHDYKKIENYKVKKKMMKGDYYDKY